MRIGIVDDHPLFRLGLRQALDCQADIHVRWDAGSVGQARRLLDQAPVDVLLMDVNLGGYLDGVTAARSICRESPCVKVVMISAAIDDYIVLAAQQAGASGYLAKDLKPDEVARHIRAITSERGTVAGANGTNLMERFQNGVRANARLRREVSRLGRLTLRESQVLGEMRQGRTNREIAIRLGVSVNTINKHVHHLLKKLKVRNRAQAAILLGQLSDTVAQDRLNPVP